MTAIITANPLLLKYTFAWLGMMALAIVNGGLREFLYKPHIGDLAAHQVSTGLLLFLLAAYFRFLAALWPLASSTQAWTVGLIWLLLTLAFEFGFGHFIAGHSWSRLASEYNVFAGRIWILIPLCVVSGPALFFYFR